MTTAQHRAPVEYTVPMVWAAALAVGVGLLAGLVIGLVTAPDQQSVSRGLLLGLILGVPAGVAVVFSRRAVAQGAPPWLVSAGGLMALVLVAALLFALSQLDVAMAPLGAALGVATGVVSLGIGLWLVHRGESEGTPEHRRS